MGARFSRHRGFGYAVAVASVLVALAVQHALGVHWVGSEPLFFAAVMVSAYVGGLGPGLVATALAAMFTAYYFLDAPGALEIEGEDVVRTFVFIAVAVLISSLQAQSRRSEQNLRRAEKEAVAANRAKDRFLAVVSHELRNPLSPVLTVASMNEQDASLSPQVREDMAMIRRNVELETRLIDDLLDHNRIQAGKLSLRRESVDVARVVKDVVEMCAEAAKEKGVSVVVEPPAGSAPDGWTRVDGDPARMRQVMWNLLSNAIKFTPAGGRVVVRVDRTPDALRIEVRDTGVGIAPELLPRVFEVFEQGGGEVTKKFGGLGLGLAIARALAVAHGGNIEAASDGPGRGSTFTLRLPVAPQRASEAPAQSPAPQPVAASIFPAA
jgi:signal transduction histidine kinase